MLINLSNLNWRLINGSLNRLYRKDVSYDVRIGAYIYPSKEIIMWTSFITGMLSGCFFALTSVTIEGYSWWQVLLIAIVPSIVGFGLSLIIKWLVASGKITKEQGDALEKQANTKLDDALDDFKDDGKINNSNKSKGE